MIDTQIGKKPRGRPRAFDTEEALTRAEALFHARGYDAVGVAALVEALGINPPSFYAAFGSKAALFERVLERYAAAALPLDRLLAADRDITAALTDLLETAARIYTADSAARGCLVLETGELAARRFRNAAHDRVRAFIAATKPDAADRLADFVDVMLSGLSARAREGWESDRLVAAAGSAALAIPAVLAG